MRKTLLALSVAFAAFAGRADTVTTNLIGEVVVVGSDHSLYPSNAVATVRQIAQTVAEAEADRATARVVLENQEYLNEKLEYLQDEYNKREGIVYIKGFVRMFDGAITVDTNATSEIIRFAKVNGFSGAREGYSYYKFNTWFSTDIQDAPVLKYCRSLGRTNNWEAITTVYGVWEDVVQVEDGEAVLYQTYAQIVEIPSSYDAAFFRVFAELVGGGDSIMFNVNNGLSVNGTPGLTQTFGEGSNAVAIVGGIFVQNDAETEAAETD